MKNTSCNICSGTLEGQFFGDICDKCLEAFSDAQMAVAALAVYFEADGVCLNKVIASVPSAKFTQARALKVVKALDEATKHVKKVLKLRGKK